MAKVLLAITVSLDGYIAGPDDGAELPLGQGGEPLFEWFFTGDTPSKYNEMFRLSKPSAKFFDDGIDTCGAVISGRRTYDIAGAWDGNGPVPGCHCSCSPTPSRTRCPRRPCRTRSSPMASTVPSGRPRQPRVTSTWPSPARRPGSSA